MLPCLEYRASIWDPSQTSLINQLEMVRHRAAYFVLNCPWSRSFCDSISQMLGKLNWCPLEIRRKQSCLLLLFKLLNQFVYIPENLLPVYSPSGITRASHSIQLIKPYARINVYLNSFFPRTISDWNNVRKIFEYCIYRRLLRTF